MTIFTAKLLGCLKYISIVACATLTFFRFKRHPDKAVVLLASVLRILAWGQNVLQVFGFLFLFFWTYAPLLPALRLGWNLWLRSTHLWSNISSWSTICFIHKKTFKCLVNSVIVKKKIFFKSWIEFVNYIQYGSSLRMGWTVLQKTFMEIQNWSVHVQYWRWQNAYPRMFPGWCLQRSTA